MKRYRLGLPKKLAFCDLFRQRLKKCLRPGAQTPRPPGTGGKRVPCGAKGSASPVGCCHRRWQSDPKRGSETIRATVREARMIEQPGHLGPKGPKRPEGGERNERWAQPAPAAKIERPGKAGRYESTLEDLRALQTSGKGFVKSPRRSRLFLGLVLVVLLLLAGACARAQEQVQALFINVGKADAALFFLDDQRFLVDTGTKDSYDQLERVLEAYGVTRLNGVVITHTDKDHVGGLKKLLKSDIAVDRVYAGALHSEKSLEDHPVYEAAEKYAVPLTWLSAGDSIALEGGGAFDVLGPLTQDDEQENNNSLVLRLTTPQGDMLLTGDMELPEESELIEAGLISQAAVLKVAHHGNEDATSWQFVLLARPQWAVISTSSVEKPETPSSKVLSRLYDVKAGVAVTQDAEVGILVTLRDGQAGAEAIDWR